MSHIRKQLFGDAMRHERDFYPTPAMQPKMARNMRNMFQRIQLSQQDVQSLFGIFKALSRPPPGEGDK